MVSFGTTQAGKQDAITNVQHDIDNVKDIMTENIERVLERGERIDLLVDKTDRLGVGAHDFRVRSRGLKRRMWWKNMKLMVLLGVVIVFLIYLFVGFGCGLPGKDSFFDTHWGLGDANSEYRLESLRRLISLWRRTLGITMVHGVWAVTEIGCIIRVETST